MTNQEHSDLIAPPSFEASGLNFVAQHSADYFVAHGANGMKVASMSYPHGDDAFLAVVTVEIPEHGSTSFQAQSGPTRQAAIAKALATWAASIAFLLAPTPTQIEE